MKRYDWTYDGDEYVRSEEPDGEYVLFDDRLTPEERRVLEAVAAIPESELRSSGNWFGWAQPIGEAERARRAAEKNPETEPERLRRLCRTWGRCPKEGEPGCPCADWCAEKETG